MDSANGRNDDGRDNVHDAPLAAAAAGGIDMLPTDVRREILLRVPSDALCRLRLVHPSWRSLTSDPSFAKAHARHHPLIAGLTSCRRAVEVVDTSGHTLRRITLPPRRCALLDRSGHIVRWIRRRQRALALTTAQPGLVCLTPDHGPSLLANPATGEVTELPKNDGCSVESPTTLGFVPATVEHKALRLTLECADRVTVQRCRVVTAGAHGKWRAAPSPPMIVEGRKTGHRVVVDGVAYFLLRACARNDGVQPDTIAAFDLATEEWSLLAGPSESKLLYPKHRHEFRLAQLEGCLVIVHHHRYGSMILWFLVDRDKGVWDKRYSIEWEPSCQTDTYNPPNPLAVLDDGRIVFRVPRGITIRAYDPRTRMWADELVRLGGYFATIYEGSLLSPYVLPIKA